MMTYDESWTALLQVLNLFETRITNLERRMNLIEKQYDSGESTASPSPSFRSWSCSSPDYTLTTTTSVLDWIGHFKAYDGS